MGPGVIELKKEARKIPAIERMLTQQDSGASQARPRSPAQAVWIADVCNAQHLRGLLCAAPSRCYAMPWLGLLLRMQHASYVSCQYAAACREWHAWLEKRMWQ